MEGCEEGGGERPKGEVGDVGLKNKTILKAFLAPQGALISTARCS